ncbi:MAG: hypothetical protein ABGY08_08235 [Gammaproteobacteria bacterium]
MVDTPLGLEEKDLCSQNISVRETTTGKIIAVLRNPATGTMDENQPLRHSCFVLKSSRLRNLPQSRWESPDIACQAIVDWVAKHYREAGQSRLCFAIQGASAVGKTTLAHQIRQKLVDDAHIATWLVRRDLFIIKESGGRSFDRKSTRMLQRQLQDWQLKSEAVERLLGCPEYLPQTLAGDGIVLLDDLRGMPPDLPVNGSIYLFYDAGELTRREERRNQKAWPWWEHLRRRCSKFLFQRKLLRTAMHSTVPCLLICWSPHSKSTAQILND